MKIGLEFEGVIKDYNTGQIARWNKIPAEIQEKIMRLIYVRRPRVAPCDRYDALAEVRTPPIENPTAEKLITALFSEMELTSKAFLANGYEIQWWEQEIPQALHNEIRHGWDEKKDDKPTSTFIDGIPTPYQSVGNLYRGGGLHINVSYVPKEFAPGLVLGIHEKLRQHRGYVFRSHYRTNVLYRWRYDQVEATRTEANRHTPVYNFGITEYMSHGFNVPTLNGWQEEWADNVNQAYNHNYPPKFIWAVYLMGYLVDYFKEAKAIR